jgi:hypothetical protein
MDTKTFKLGVVFFYGIPNVIILIPALLLIMTYASTIFADEKIREGVRNIAFFGTFFGSIYALNYLLTASCLITVNSEGINMEITKWGIGVRRKKIFYTWADVESFRDYQVRGGRNVGFYFRDDNHITFSDDSRVLYLYLKKYFPTKEF